MDIANRILGFLKAIFRALTLSSLACLPGFAGCGTEVYDLYIDVNVPRVYDNANSLGYRRYQRQRLQGVLYADEDGVRIEGLYNRKHKVGGVHVRYTCEVDNAEWAIVGNNRTGVFKRPSVKFALEAVPSYIGAYEPTDDETLVLTLAGSGTFNRISGYVAGTLGCGCSWYGHTSPTRSYFTCDVVDKAAVYGRFRLKRRK